MRSEKVAQILCGLAIVAIMALGSWVAWHSKLPQASELRYRVALSRGDFGTMSIEHAKLKMGNDPNPDVQVRCQLQFAIGHAFDLEWDKAEQAIDNARNLRPATYADSAGFSSTLEHMMKAGTDEQFKQAQRLCKRALEECPFYCDQGRGDDQAKKLKIAKPVRTAQLH